MRNRKNIFQIVVLLLILGAIGYAVSATLIGRGPEEVLTSEETTICTMDAMECPDGSYVGRTGPNCEFVCPTSVASTTKRTPVTVDVKLDQKVTPIAESITVLSVTEDSRCPKDVQCIQAGTVKVSVRIESGMGIATETFEIGNTITTETEEMTLVSVSPEPVSTTQILPNEYTFRFRVARR